MPRRRPTATLTPAIRVGNMVYGSGQLGMNHDNPDTTCWDRVRTPMDRMPRCIPPLMRAALTGGAMCVVGGGEQ